jgi:hypothetical protein
MEAASPDIMTVSDAERAGLVWKKASASTSYGQCVELAAAAGGVAMRDSKDPDGPILLYARAEFNAFLDGARNGDFDGIGQ